MHANTYAHTNTQAVHRRSHAAWRSVKGASAEAAVCDKTHATMPQGFTKKKAMFATQQSRATPPLENPKYVRVRCENLSRLDGRVNIADTLPSAGSSHWEGQSENKLSRSVREQSRINSLQHVAVQPDGVHHPPIVT